MKKLWLKSSMLVLFVGIASMQAGRACVLTGNVTCDTFLSTACDGDCDGDVCLGTQVDEYSCSDGSIQFVDE